MSYNKNLINNTLEDVMSNDFAKYAKYIIQDRALPDIRDGLKPVQRRIIYAMNNLRLFYDAPHKKSARTVGEVIGKYHPHGDTSIYDAMVRMSQQWKNNNVLLDMHGNNGSIDGDSAAAMRYTECRLSRFGQLMTENINKNTVEFTNNFDDSEKEPIILPTLLPNLLINGASGIAAGYATNIPPFNTNEIIEAIITRIDSPNCHLKSILDVMPAPDFPTGGIILNKQGILDAYNNGKSKIYIRGEIKKLNDKQVVIKSIPYETNKSQIIRQLDEIKEKYDVLNIKEVRDESDKNGINIVLDVNKINNFDLLKNIIYKESEMQITFGINMVAILNHKPVQFSIFQALDEYIKHANHVIIVASKYDLDKSLKRKEIVEGLIKAINIIDDVVYIIRNASNKDNAKQNIMNRLAFTELQAEAIVNLRLYHLSNTDVNNLKDELTNLNKNIQELKLIIDSQQYRNNLLKKKLREFKKIFGHNRLSQISDENEKIQIDTNETIDDREMTIIATRDGYLKSLSKQVFSNVDYKTIRIKDGDIPIAQFISNQKDKCLFITSLGNYVCIPTYKIQQAKWKDIGIHINNLVKLTDNEKIINAFNFDNNINDQRCLVIVTEKGMIKRTLIRDLNISKNIKISKIIKLSEHDLISDCLLLNNDRDETNIGIINSNGVGYITNSNQISLVSATAAGVKAMNLNNNDKVIGIFAFSNNEINNKTLLLVANTGMKRIKLDQIPFSNRPSIGKSLVNQPKSNPSIITSIHLVKSNSTIQLVNEIDQLCFIKSSEIIIGDKNTKISKLQFKKIKIANIAPHIDSKVDFNKSNNLLDYE